MDDKFLPIMTGKTRKKLSLKKASRTAVLIVSFFVTGYAIAMSLLSAEPVSFGRYLERITEDGKWFFGALLLFAAVVLFETLRFIIMIYMTKKQFRPILAFRTAMIGRFYHAVTPYTNGGQGLQSQVLVAAKFNRATSFSIPFSQVFLKTMVWNLMLLFFFIFNRQGIAELRWLALIGLVFNGFFPVLFFVFSFNERLAKKIISKILKAGARLRLVKNYEFTLSGAYSFLEDLSISVRSIVRNTKYFILLLLLYAAEFMAVMSIPYFMFKSVGEDVTYPFMLISYMYIYLSMTYVPIPGAAGAYEISFFTMYSSSLASGMGYWVLLSVRFFTYFFYILTGYFLLAIDAVTRRVRRKKEVRRLVAEHIARQEAEAREKQAAAPPLEEAENCAGEYVGESVTERLADEYIKVEVKEGSGGGYTGESAGEKPAGYKDVNIMIEHTDK
ncbi:MAG: flippase-like domain-containing protein [Clostridiales bacterium]|jgi:uncharacterized protein (TIRG00374 family)|nr:flippase-like domain-containing protein [Clostridiales bacterium]